jgi:hypothetical protein
MRDTEGLQSTAATSRSCRSMVEPCRGSASVRPATSEAALDQVPVAAPHRIWRPATRRRLLLLLYLHWTISPSCSPVPRHPSLTRCVVDRAPQDPAPLRDRCGPPGPTAAAPPRAGPRAAATTRRHPDGEDGRPPPDRRHAAAASCRHPRGEERTAGHRQILEC